MQGDQVGFGIHCPGERGCGKATEDRAPSRIADALGERTETTSWFGPYN